MKSIFEKPVTELMRYKLKDTEFKPEVKESSGLSDMSLSDEELEELIEKED